MTLLPVTSGDLEKKLETLGERFDFSNPSNDLWDPDNCPEKALIYLAWALSVDNWSDNWIVEVKRDVVKNSLDIHRLKGTTVALYKAVNTLGYKANVEYWHENNTLDKGTFNVNISASGIKIDQSFYGEMLEVINENKRGTLHLNSMIVSSGSNGNLHCGAHVKIGEHFKILPRKAEVYKIVTRQTIGAMIRVVDKCTILPRT